jgi:hypothetical protein
MKLTRLCKSGDSVNESLCPAMYLADDPTMMVSQGKRLDPETTAQLRDLANDEIAHLIPTETVLRAAALVLAAHGRAALAAEITASVAQPQVVSP